MKEKQKFNLRSFTSFSLVISTLIMSWSGKFTVKSTAQSTGKDIEADGETSIRTIADKLGMTPRDVYTMLTENN